MNAITAPPKSVGCRRLELRVGDHVAERGLAGGVPAGGARVMSAVIAPTIWFAIGAEAVSVPVDDRGQRRILRDGPA